MEPGQRSQTESQRGRAAQDQAAGAVRLSERQRTRISRSIARLDVAPLRDVDFSVSVGAVVPASVRLHLLPSSIVAIVPQYRGYEFVLVRDEIVIVHPRTHRIVTVLPYSGSAQASVDSRPRKLSRSQREVIRRKVIIRETTAVAPSEEIVVGETLPETVVVREFPEIVYREVPTVRSYRYILRGRDLYLVDPGERRVIDLID
jgi:hypothetical protein